jgi:hypothetical protein
MILVFPTLWSPKNTILYFANGAKEDDMIGRVAPTAEFRLTTEEPPEACRLPPPVEADFVPAADVGLCWSPAATAALEADEGSDMFSIF